MPCLSGGLGPRRGCRGRGAGLEAARGGGAGWGKFRSLRAPGGELFVSSAESRHNSDCSSTALSAAWNLNPKMTGALERWARARLSLRGSDASGVDWNKFGFMGGSPHCFAPKARAGLPNRCERKQPFSFLFCSFAPEPFVRPRCICVGIGCTAPFWSVAAAARFGNPAGLAACRAQASKQP